MGLFIYIYNYSLYGYDYVISANKHGWMDNRPYGMAEKWLKTYRFLGF